MGFKEKAMVITRLIKSGNPLKAFEQFYHDDVIMRENQCMPREGKTTNRNYEQNLIQAIESLHQAEVLSIAFGDQVSTVEWLFDFTLKSIGRIQRKQVAIQHWKEGKIIYEQFYYAD